LLQLTFCWIHKEENNEIVIRKCINSMYVYLSMIINAFVMFMWYRDILYFCTDEVRMKIINICSLLFFYTYNLTIFFVLLPFIYYSVFYNLNDRQYWVYLLHVNLNEILNVLKGHCVHEIHVEQSPVSWEKEL
jgi:hypothetical protein